MLDVLPGKAGLENRESGWEERETTYHVVDNKFKRRRRNAEITKWLN
jgi:hypothetical protein